LLALPDHNFEDKESDVSLCEEESQKKENSLALWKEMELDNSGLSWSPAGKASPLEWAVRGGAVAAVTWAIVDAARAFSGAAEGARVAIHWDYRGVADVFVPSRFGLVVTPLIMCACLPMAFAQAK
jgi:hypothetical protein